jgi:hypothetical protein
MRVRGRRGLVFRPGCGAHKIRRSAEGGQKDNNSVRGLVTTLLLVEALLTCLPRAVCDLLGFKTDERARVGASSAMAEWNAAERAG